MTIDFFNFNVLTASTTPISIDIAHTYDGLDNTVVASGSGTLRWSDPNTWGGSLPKAGKAVIIPQGVTVLLDTSTPNLAGVTVAGSLIVSEKHGDINATADWLWVDEGNFQVGTVADPYDQAKFTLTLDGANEDVNGMGYGGRFLLATGGTVEMQGNTAKSWTTLEQTVQPGSSKITIANATGWKPGDQILIAPSGVKAFEGETRTITNIQAQTLNGKSVAQLTLDRPLSYGHYGQVDTIDGKLLDMRAEVALLNRSIKIQGSEDSETTKFGFHGEFAEGAIARLENVEFYRGGQLGQKGRYPVHFHHLDDAAGSYIKNSVVHNSFHRGIVLHGTSNLNVDSNVVYNVFSHAYIFSEDGNEWNNSFTNNLGVLAKSIPQDKFAFFNQGVSGKSTQAEGRPSIFWGRNYYNPMIGNHAAGAENGSGFHFDIRGGAFYLTQPFLNSTNANIFRDNVAHSNETIDNRLTNYAVTTAGHGLMMELFNGKSSTPIVFENLTSYKNENGGAWLEDKRQVLKNAVLADNSTGIITQRSVIQGGVITSRSKNIFGGVIGSTRQALDGNDMGGGIHILLNAGGPTVRNVSFIDVAKAAFTMHYNTRIDNGASTSGLKLINTAKPVYWAYRSTNTNPGFLSDLDGTLVGKPARIYGPAAVGISLKLFVPEYNAFVLPT